MFSMFMFILVLVCGAFVLCVRYEGLNKASVIMDYIFTISWCICRFFLYILFRLFGFTRHQNNYLWTTPCGSCSSSLWLTLWNDFIGYFNGSEMALNYIWTVHCSPHCTHQMLYVIIIFLIKPFVAFVWPFDDWTYCNDTILTIALAECTIEDDGYKPTVWIKLGKFLLLLN